MDFCYKMNWKGGFYKEVQLCIVRETPKMLLLHFAFEKMIHFLTLTFYLHTFERHGIIFYRKIAPMLDAAGLLI